MSNNKYIRDLERHKKFWSKFWSNLKTVGNLNINNKCILDFGCGTGLCLKTALDNGISSQLLHGLDVDQKVTNNDDTFNTFHKMYGLDNQIIKFYDGEIIPFNNEFFDIIISQSSILQDNTQEVVNLSTNNKLKLEKRIIDLIKISTNNATWCVSPTKAWSKVKNIFMEHKKNKKINVIDLRALIDGELIYFNEEI